MKKGRIQSPFASLYILFAIFDVATGTTGTAEFAPAFPAHSRPISINLGLAVGLQSEFHLETMIIGLHKN